MQCVGGAKFGLQAVNSNDQDVLEGIEALKKIQSAYKAEVKQDKQLAIANFVNSGKMDDVPTQTVYTEALAAAEMTPGGLKSRLGEHFTHSGNNISYKGKKVAEIKTGASAYVVSQAASGGTAAVYKRHTLSGLSGQEYVDIRGSMVRRFAYRGITPPERKAYKEGHALVPQNRGRETLGLMGFNYNEATGEPELRQYDASTGKITDLEWLKQNAKINMGQVPNDPQLLAFMQTRKGVGKALSLTSTPKPITSNHGEVFTGFGRIEVDLAQVPVNDISHTYKDNPFNANTLAAVIGGNGGPLAYTTARANETVLRNRELVLTQIPNAAVTHLTDTVERQAYEAEFRKTYKAAYKKAFAEFLNDDDNFPIPDPAQYPYVENHYTEMQAKQEGVQINQRARQDALRDATLRNEYVKAYKAAYDKAWQDAYQEAAWDVIVANDPMSSDSPRVPKAPEPGAIPNNRTGKSNGAADGHRDGRQDGDQAGQNYQV